MPCERLVVNLRPTCTRESAPDRNARKWPEERLTSGSRLCRRCVEGYDWVGSKRRMAVHTERRVVWKRSKHTLQTSFTGNSTMISVSTSDGSPSNSRLERMVDIGELLLPPPAALGSSSESFRPHTSCDKLSISVQDVSHAAEMLVVCVVALERAKALPAGAVVAVATVGESRSGGTGGEVCGE